MQYRIFETEQEYNIFTVNGQKLVAGDIYIVKETKTLYFVTNNLDGDNTTYDYIDEIPPEYVLPTGNKVITENGEEIDVYDYATVTVNVPVPEGYIIPAGNTTITANGTDIDVNDYATATVDVHPTLRPAIITQNGTYTPSIGDGYDEVTVNVNTGTVNPAFNKLIDGSILSLVIPDGTTKIGDFAFNGCWGLTSVTIPSSVTSIGSNAFQDCRDLTGTLTIPSSVTSIGNSAFSNCSGLTGTLTIPSSVTSIGDGTFSGCSGLTSLSLPNTLTSIGAYAFSRCSGLTSLTLPNTLTSIDQGAFSGCSGLTDVTIGSGVTSIGYEAFRNCTGLTSVTIPSGVTSINKGAFRDCSGLTEVTVLATTPPTLRSNSFDNTNNCPIYVPCGSVDAYKAAAGWSTYADRIQCIDYFTIHALTNGTIDILENGLHQSGYDILEYSKDNGTTYTSFSSPISVNGGDNVRFRVMTSKIWNGYQFSATCDFDVEGDLECLIISWGQTNIARMFQDCTTLRSAERLVIPDNAVCGGMFSGCTSLVTPPQLPATTLADRCYAVMFFNCTSLTTAPQLPATTLTESCYLQMFRNCTNLNYIKCLATDMSAEDCLAAWVDGVASSGTFVKDSSADWGTCGDSAIPCGWDVEEE